MLSSFINRSIGLLFLVIYSPLILLIAIWIKIDSPGKIIFSQTRVGKNLKPFTFYKFRTMWKDAREKYPELYKYEYSETEIKKMKFKISNDPRVTRAGSYLRMISLDELPNLINVLKGEMNLIGPRPEIPEMTKYYEPHQMKKFTVKPGITGLAQVNGRGLLSVQKTIHYDLLYVKKKTLCLDVYLFWKTMFVVIKALGAF